VALSFMLGHLPGCPPGRFWSPPGRPIPPSES